LTEPNKAELPQHNPSDLKEKFKAAKPKNAKPFKYFSNLYEELEIDPMIAADLAKLS
jgi:hypothetical protein